MRIAILAAALAAVFMTAAAKGDAAVSQTDSGIFDLTNVKCLCGHLKVPAMVPVRDWSPYFTPLPPDTPPTTVVLTYIIGSDGSVSDEKIVLSSGMPDFDAKVLASFSRRPYRPAEVDGKPIAVRVATRAYYWQSAAIGRLPDIEQDGFIYQLTDWLNERKPSIAYSLARGRDEDIMGRHSEALVDFDRVLKTDPQNVVALHDRAVVYGELGNYDSAVHDDTDALAENPQDAASLIDRAFTYDVLGKHELAAADHKTVAALAPSCAPVRTFESPRCQDAYNSRIKALDKRIAANAGDLDAYAQRCAERATAAGDLSMALADCNHVLDRLPENQGSLSMRALVFYRMGMFPSALKDYDASLKANPFAYSDLYLRGIVKTRMNLTVDGRADILTALVRNIDVAADAAFWGVYP
ncbi:MAG TPA: tetratricopeptide repeat protein [Rhizomicrobium sp.]